MIVVDPVNRMLYEFYQVRKTAAGWQACAGSIFDLKSNKLRPDGWTSTDAAGLPIFPAIIRYDELERGMVEHAMRVTVRHTRREYVYPATHFASRRRTRTCRGWASGSGCGRTSTSPASRRAGRRSSRG